MAQTWQNWYRVSGAIAGLGFVGLWWASAIPVSAQIAPDRSLGNESSIVSPNATVRGLPADLIQGGATRGVNLFHSFSQFNVRDGQRVYFANPVGIETILSRVTGAYPSRILGTLGVDGAANLFLINPNGILFGANARLDVAGSFLASTANSFKFPDGSEFSATDPKPAPLLTINITPGLQYGPNHQATIANAGNLSAGKNLTLAAGNLDLQGQLQSGGDLTLRALDTVKVRDSVTTPFIAAANGKLTVQGDRAIDIFALNHPQSGFFSDGNMVLRSSGTVLGDARYSSGKGFRIETLDGAPGNLYSPYDPFIISNGDVTFGSYSGASLHILAGGSVTIGTVTITGNGTVDSTVNPINTPDYAFVTLSDGTRTVIDGSTTPTLDIRAGIDWSKFVGGAPGNYGIGITGLLPANFSEPPSSANITIQNIENNFFGSVVLLTNQFVPNPALPGGIITIGPDRTSAYGLVAIDARSDIRVNGNIVSAVSNGNAGDVKLISGGNVVLPGTVINTTMTGTGRAGNIAITAKSLFLDNRASVFSSTAGMGDAGDVSITATDIVSLSNGSGIRGLVEGGGNGRAGNITIQTRSLFVTGGSQIGSALFREQVNSGIPGAKGSGGTIRVKASDTVFLSGNNSDGFSSGLIALSERGAQGSAGSVFVDVPTGNLRVEKGAVIATGTRNEGNSGSIVLNVKGLEVLEGGRIQANTDGLGAGGDIAVTATDKITIAGVDSNFARRLAQINNYLLSNPNDRIDDVFGGFNVILENSGLFSNTAGGGSAGNIKLTAPQITLADRGFVISGTTGEANSGNVAIQSQVLSITGGSEVLAQTQGMGSAGVILVQPIAPSLRSSASITISGVAPYTGLDANGNPNGGFSSGLFVTTEDPLDASGSPIPITGAGGAILLETGTLRISDGGVVSARSRSDGNGGDILANVDTLTLTSGGQIVTTAYRNGNAGNIFVQATGKVTISGEDSNHITRFNQIEQDIRLDLIRKGTPVEEAANEAFEKTRFTVDPFNGASGLQANVGQGAVANAGFVAITAGSLDMSNRGEIGTSIFGTGNAGDVFVTTNGGSVTLNNASIFSTVESGGEGKGGNIVITTGSLFISNAGSLQTLLRRASEDPGDTRPGAKGDAGVIAISATDSISIVGKGENADFATGIFTTIERGADGNTGDNFFAGNIFNSILGLPGEPIGSIFIQTGSLSLTEGALLDSSTFGAGNAGAVVIQANGTISLDGKSRIQSVAGQTAVKDNAIAGGIVIQAKDLFLNNSSGLSTSVGNAERTGDGIDAGLIFVSTQQSIRLDRGSEISSETASGQGGNIFLQPTELLVLRRNSTISTTAGTAEASGDGGNIFINTRFIVATPRTNSDIKANAFSGSGGRVEISAQTIFGMIVRSRDDLQRLLKNPPLDPIRLSTNDITAISQQNPLLNGIVDIETFGVDPSRGLQVLPGNLVDPSGLIVQGCVSSGPQRASSFVSKGRGGIAPSPTDPLQDESVLTDWAAVPTSDRNPRENAPPTAAKAQPPTEIIEAQGWVQGPDGTISLVAYPANGVPNSSWLKTPNCGDRRE